MLKMNTPKVPGTPYLTAEEERMKPYFWQCIKENKPFDWYGLSKEEQDKIVENYKT